MNKQCKLKIKVKERVDDNICDLSLSELSEVPVQEIAAIKRVTILDLSSNKLISLQKNFTIQLTQLVRLDLSKNEIQQLPNDFGLLRNLRHLDLYDNKLKYLPLSFCDLINLRYLDLKGNPLLPTLSQAIGLCLTSKECQEAAKRAVRYLSVAREEANKRIEIARLEVNKKNVQANANIHKETVEIKDGQKTQMNPNELKKLKKPKTKARTKSKKSNPNIMNNNNNNNEIINKTNPLSNGNNVSINKTSKLKKSGSGSGKKNKSKSSTALFSIMAFFILLAVNIGIIYFIMFNNPDITDEIIEMVPSQYRNWILSKTEIFRLRVTDWISQFRTLPEEQ